MKVVFLDTTMGGDLIGGAHTFLHKIFRGLSENNVEVHFVTEGEPSAKTALNIENSGATVHTQIWSKGLLVEDSAPILAEWINKLKPDVYVVSVSPDIGWAVLPYLTPDIATLTIGHNDVEQAFYLPVRHYKSFLTRAVGVSPEICMSYVLSCGMKKEKVEWIPYGVQASEIEPTDDGENVLKMVYVGRLDEIQKRISDLIKVVKLLSEREVNFKLSIVGDGEEMPAIKENLNEEINAGKVELYGWVDGEEVIKILRESEVFVLTSGYEGFCIALVEAMANGCCPVVTDIRSGNKQLIENETNGFLIEIGDAEGFAEKLAFLSENRAELLKMRKLAWQTGKEYGVAKMIESYESCFEKAIEDAKIEPREVNAKFPLMPTCRSRFPLWLRRLKAKTRQYVSAI